MNDIVNGYLKQPAAALVAILLVLSVFGPVGTAAADPSVSVEQTADSTTVAPGETVTLTTEFTVAELNAPQMSVEVPDGWGITEQTAEGPSAYNDGTWTWLSGDDEGVDVSYTVEYTVSVPEDASPGEYSISADGSALSPADSASTSDSDSTTITVEDPDQNEDPTASFTASPSSPEAGETVSFDASDSSDADGTIESYEWDFDGDGETDATGEQVTNAFDAAGDYDVTLTVTDDGATAQATQTVSVSEVPNQDPTASISGPSSAQVDEQVTFDAADSSDADGSIESYEWDFGDGETATGQSVSHTFDSAGDYTVELTVTDDDGATATATQSVSVSSAPEPGNFQVADLEAPSSATQGDNVTVEATVENTGDEAATQSVAFTFDGTQLDSQDLTLSDGKNETVSFTVSTSAVEPGTYTHGVSTDDDSASAEIAITEPEPEPEPEAVDVSFEPAEKTALTTETVTYDIVVSGTDDVGSFEGSVELSNTDNATITDVTTPASEGFEEITIDGQSAEFEMFGLPSDTSDPVTVATVTVSADAVGDAALSLSADFVSDQQGNGYTVDSTSGATLVVGLDPVVGDNPPANLDGDPVLEDVNGDGEFNVGDAQALFYNQDSDVVQNNTERFDFNGDGEINVGDAQAAFYQAVGQES